MGEWRDEDVPDPVIQRIFGKGNLRRPQLEDPHRKSLPRRMNSSLVTSLRKDPTKLHPLRWPPQSFRGGKRTSLGPLDRHMHPIEKLRTPVRSLLLPRKAPCKPFLNTLSARKGADLSHGLRPSDFSQVSEMMMCKSFNPILRKWIFAKIPRPEGYSPTTDKMAYFVLIM
jgi:hypothetical protein